MAKGIGYMFSLCPWIGGPICAHGLGIGIREGVIGLIVLSSIGLALEAFVLVDETIEESRKRQKK